MTLQQYFAQEGIDIEFLIKNFADTAPYWNNAINFVKEKWMDDMKLFSDKQYGWAVRILEDAVEKRIEG